MPEINVPPSTPQADLLRFSGGVVPPARYISGVDSRNAGYVLVVGLMASNMVGFAPGIDANFDFSDPRVLQYASSGTYQNQIILATEPLQHISVQGSSIGNLLTFGKELATILPTSNRVLIIPFAAANYGFASNQFNPGDPSYNSLVSRLNTLLTGTTNQLACFITIPDGGDRNYTQTQYATRLDAMINGLRASVVGASNTPWLLGSYTPQSIIDQPERQNVQNAVNDTPNRLARVGVVPNTGLTNATGDSVHYNAVSQRELGRKFFNLYKTIAGV